MFVTFLLVWPTTGSLLKYSISAIPSLLISHYLENLIFFFFVISRSSLLSCHMIPSWNYLSYVPPFIHWTLPCPKVENFQNFKKDQLTDLCQWKCLKTARKFLLSTVLTNIWPNTLVNKTGKFSSELNYSSF